MTHCMAQERKEGGREGRVEGGWVRGKVKRKKEQNIVK